MAVLHQYKHLARQNRTRPPHHDTGHMDASIERRGGMDLRDIAGVSAGGPRGGLAHGHSGWRDVAKGLGWFSIALGLAEVTAAEPIARALGFDRSKAGFLRLCGLREIASGLGILWSDSDAAAASWVWSRVGGDAIDLAALAPALKPENPERETAIIATAAVAGITALDAITAQKLHQLGR